MSTAASPSLVSRLDKLSRANSARRPTPRGALLGIIIVCLVFVSIGQNRALQSAKSGISLSVDDFDDIPVLPVKVPRVEDDSHAFPVMPAKVSRAEGSFDSVVDAKSTVSEVEMVQTQDGPIDDGSLPESSMVAVIDEGDLESTSTASVADLVEADFPVLDRSEERSPSSSSLANEESSLDLDESSELFQKFYKARLLPPPQLDFFPRSGRQIKYQMHNCLKGRDGSKAGLLNAGVPRVLSQKSLENMPLHIIDPWASIMVACNAKVPMFRITRDPRIAGKRLVSSAQGLLTKLCLGSMKTKQLECRRALSDRWGCSYESLGVQPAQYVMDDPKQCERLFIDGHARDRSWLSKPSGGIRGRGIKYFANTVALEKDIAGRGGCLKSNATGLRGRLVQEYVNQPALIDGKFKFDVRTWLLVASVDPLVIFYHEGFVRVAKQPYNEKSKSKLVHITNSQGQYGDRNSPTNAEDEEDGKYMRSFDHVSEQLHRVHGLPKDYMQNSFRKQMMRSQTFAALAQYTLDDPPDLVTKKGFYQIYACDSMIDRFGGAHLLECNGFPAESQQTSVTGRDVWGEMIALLLNLHLEPWRLLSDSTPPPGIKRNRYIREGIWKTGPEELEHGDTFKANEYAFGKWYLTFNEMETPLRHYNVCTI